MKHRRKARGIVLIGIALLAVLALAGCASPKNSAPAAQPSGDVLAEFHGRAFTKADLEQEEIKASGLTEAEALKQLLLDEIYLVEAEKLGLTATEAECADFVAEQKSVYEQFPEAAAELEEYCKGAGITLDEFYANLQKTAPDVIARNKMANRFAEEYWAGKGLDRFSSHTMEEYAEYSEAYDKYRAELLAAYQDQIVYY